MKKKVLVEKHVCDECSKTCDYPDTCLRCKKEFCYPCSKKCGKTYTHGVYIGGGGDGFYCTDCDEKLRIRGNDARYNAYRHIAFLKQEATEWSADFRRRQEAAESLLKQLS